MGEFRSPQLWLLMATHTDCGRPTTFGVPAIERDAWEPAGSCELEVLQNVFRAVAELRLPGSPYDGSWLRCLHRYADLPAGSTSWHERAASTHWVAGHYIMPPRSDARSSAGGGTASWVVLFGSSMPHSDFQQWQRSGKSPTVRQRLGSNYFMPWAE